MSRLKRTHKKGILIFNCMGRMLWELSQNSSEILLIRLVISTMQCLSFYARVFDELISNGRPAYHVSIRS